MSSRAKHLRLRKTSHVSEYGTVKHVRVFCVTRRMDVHGTRTLITRNICVVFKAVCCRERERVFLCYAFRC